jgi:hypothetical protein
MGLLTGIKALFAVPKVAGDVFDKDDGLLAKAGGFINDLDYSDQEKARDLGKVTDALAKHVEKTMGENTVRSKTRREISIMWIKVQLAFLLMVAICIPFSDKLAKSYYELATCEVMLYGTLAALGFFLGGYMWGTHIQKKG